jgi:hypothetical protein
MILRSNSVGSESNEPKGRGGEWEGFERDDDDDDDEEEVVDRCFNDDAESRSFLNSIAMSDEVWKRMKKMQRMWTEMEKVLYYSIDYYAPLFVPTQLSWLWICDTSISFLKWNKWKY